MLEDNNLNPEVFGEVTGGAAVVDHPIIRGDLCVKCNRCADICTEKAVSIVNGVYKINSELCTKCGACADLCPVNAIFGLK